MNSSPRLKPIKEECISFGCAFAHICAWNLRSNVFTNYDSLLSCVFILLKWTWKKGKKCYFSFQLKTGFCKYNYFSWDVTYTHEIIK